jgi:arsenite methyltransferase
MVAILSNQRDAILAAVRDMYTAVATEPARGFHFPTGRAACELFGYPASDLDAIPAAAVESFAGVGYPFLARVIAPGNVILDVGSGSGTDVLIAARKSGKRAKVFALDMTAAMRAKLRANLHAADATHVEILDAGAEDIPLSDASVDVVTSNGVLNLVPDKSRAIGEIARVLRRGGWLQVADIVLSTEPSEACRARADLWAECVVGAMTDRDFLDQLRTSGFDDVEVLRRYDYFAASPSAETRKVAVSFGGISMVVRARKGH